MLTIILTVIFIISCFILIGVVLLQSGKADAAALFGGGGATTFGPRGTATILQKVTIGAAVSFMLITFLFMIGIGGPRSAAGGVKDRPAATVPTPTPAPAPDQNQPPAPAQQPPK